MLVLARPSPVAVLHTSGPASAFAVTAPAIYAAPPVGGNFPRVRVRSLVLSRRKSGRFARMRVAAALNETDDAGRKPPCRTSSGGERRLEDPEPVSAQDSLEFLSVVASFAESADQERKVLRRREAVKCDSRPGC